MSTIYDICGWHRERARFLRGLYFTSSAFWEDCCEFTGFILDDDGDTNSILCDPAMIMYMRDV